MNQWGIPERSDAAIQIHHLLHQSADLSAIQETPLNPRGLLMDLEVFALLDQMGDLTRPRDVVDQAHWVHFAISLQRRLAASFLTALPPPTDRGLAQDRTLERSPFAREEVVSRFVLPV